MQREDLTAETNCKCNSDLKNDDKIHPLGLKGYLRKFMPLA